jgi:gamma-glutamyltranspeptidase/glutathione hydrolase
MPPNSYGIYMLLQLATLADVDFSKLGPEAPERYAALIAASQAAFEAGDRYVADPRSAPRSDPLLEADGLSKLRKDFHARAGGAPANRGGTAVVSIVDKKGNAVCIVQSVFLAFGSGVADPATGILLNNRMIGFSTRSDHPNMVAPEKQPAHTLNPVIVLEGDRVRYVLATPGGPGQTITLTQVLQAMCDHGLPLQDAIGLPRWSVDLTGSLIVEPGLPEETVRVLQKIGFDTKRAAGNTLFFGSAECVERFPEGGLVAVADDRREAYAIAI